MGITVESMLQAVISGFLLGGLYALMVFGLQIMYGVMKVINVAHTAYIILGGYLTYWIFELYGIDPFVSLAVTMPILFALGYITQMFALNPIVRAPMITSLLVMFGIGSIIEGVSTYLWTADYRSVAPRYAGTPLLTIGGLTFPTTRVAGFLGSILILAALHLFLVKTKLGKAIRAASQDIDAAQVMGVNVTRVYAFTCGIAIATAASAGAIVSMIFAIYPAMRGIFTGKLFCICALGGMGSIRGAFAAAMILGLAESLTGAIVTLQWSPIVAYLLLIITLLVKPSGLFGR